MGIPKYIFSWVVFGLCFSSQAERLRLAERPMARERTQNTCVSLPRVCVCDAYRGNLYLYQNTASGVMCAVNYGANISIVFNIHHKMFKTFQVRTIYINRSAFSSMFLNICLLLNNWQTRNMCIFIPKHFL